MCVSAVSASTLAERVQCTAKSWLAWQFFHMTLYFEQHNVCVKCVHCGCALCTALHLLLTGHLSRTGSKLRLPSFNLHMEHEQILTFILRRPRTGTVWFYSSTSNKRAARPKLYTKSLTRDLKRMYSRFTLVRISTNL